MLISSISFAMDYVAREGGYDGRIPLRLSLFLRYNKDYKYVKEIKWPTKIYHEEKWRNGLTN